MSWFDASTFSKYAKTALKQAQKNIDKVLDINEEDSSNASKYASLNPDFPYPTELISSSKSSSSSAPSSSPATKEESTPQEDDTFFNSFLGNEKTKKQTGSRSPSVSSETSKGSPRKGKLSDRQSERKKELNSPSSDTSSVDISFDLSSRESIDTTQRKGRLIDRRKEKKENPHKIESDLVKDSSPRKDAIDVEHQVANGFDDIDLSESDIDTDELDDDLISTPLKQNNLSTKLNKSGDDLDCIDQIVNTPTHIDFRAESPSTSKKTEKINETNDKTVCENQSILSTQPVEKTVSIDDENSPSKEESEIKIKELDSAVVENNAAVINNEGVSSEVIDKNDFETEKPVLDVDDNTTCSNEQSNKKLSDTNTSSNDLNIEEEKVTEKEDENSDVDDNDSDELEVSTNLRTKEWIENNIQDEVQVENKSEDFLQESSSIVVENEPCEIVQATPKNEVDPCLDDQGHAAPPAVATDSKNSSFCVINEPSDDPVEKLMTLAESQLWSSDNSNDVLAEIPYKDLPQTPYSSDVAVDHKVRDLSENNELTTNVSTPDAVIQNEVEGLNIRIAELTKEVANLQNVVEAREIKMVELSKQNISYQESISVYKSQIEQLETMSREEDSEIEEMRQEFTTRIAEVDNKCHAAIKERDQAKARLIEVEASLRQSTNEQVSVLTNSLLEKEETIKDLLNEGEALSKKEMESNQRIKKLRIKLKELNTTNTTHTEKISGLEKEIETLKEVIKDKENSETKLNNELKKLEGITDSQEDEVSALKEQLDDMEEKYKAMESTLHNTYNEINRLNLENAQKQSAIQETTNAREEKKELEERLKEVERTSKFGKEELITQLEDLQVAYSRLEQQLGRREDELKKEIEDLHKRLEHGEHRNQELSQSVSAATKPLLRQIANLQSNFTIQSESWERIEKSLTDRLASLQDQCALAVEKERVASEVAVEAKAKLKALQTRVTSLKEEKTNLQVSLDNEINKTKDQENEWKREKSTIENRLSSLKVTSMELEGEKKVLEEQLSAEKVKYENETVRLNAQIALQQQRQQQAAAMTPVKRHSRQSSTSSMTGDFDSSFQDTSSTSGGVPLQRYLSSSSSFHEGFSKGGNATTAASLEHLKSQLRSREGEVYVLQEEVRSLEKTKASLAQELVTLANRVEELEETSKDVDLLKQEHQEMTSRYNAVLQMYGEKAEENEELKMDIEDLKNMYRQQIQELCGGAR